MANEIVCAGRSASVAVTVPTPVVFSGTLGVALEVNTGGLSLTGATLIVNVWTVFRAGVPSSVAVTSTR